MRPDPYKQARSRKYQARQRAKGEGAPAQLTIASRLAEQLAKLPSNADRYGSQIPTDELHGDESPSISELTLEDAYDIGNAAQLDQILESMADHHSSLNFNSSDKHEDNADVSNFIPKIEWDKILAASKFAKNEVDDTPEYFALHAKTVHTISTTASSSLEFSKDSAVANEHANLTSMVNTEKSSSTSAPVDQDEEWLDSVLQ